MTKIEVSVMTAFSMLLTCGVAHADTNDDDFVGKLQNVGVAGAPADLIKNARSVCEGLDHGVSPDDLTDAFVSQMGFAPGRAANFVALSVTHYCPKYSNLQFKAPH